MNKLAIVTGAGRGIGRHAAHYFAENGFIVALIDWNETLLSSVQSEFAPQKSVPFLLDVSNHEKVLCCVNELISKFNRIDILFNNAGILFQGASSIGPRDFNSMLDVNLRGIYNMVHAVVPIMKKQNDGYIFNLSSNAGKRPVADSGAYCMTKYGVLGFSQSLSLELLSHNIKVTAICPSVVNTEMTKHIQNFPNKEKIQCDDIIKTIDYLLKLSPNAYVDEITVKSTYLLKHPAG